MHATRPTESPLGKSLRIQRGLAASKWGFFLRAETMHGWYSYIEQHPKPDLHPDPDPRFHELSHGESFLAMLATDRFVDGGFFVLDEPEAGLSFESLLVLIGLLAEVAADPRAQVLLATHSPVLAALPGATVLQLDDNGITPTTWEDLAVVDHYRRFLGSPMQYLRHVLPE